MLGAVAISASQLTELLAVSRALAVTTALDPLLERIVEAACMMLDSERASLFLHDRRTKELWTKFATGTREIRVPSTAGIVGAAFTSNELVHVPDPYSDPRFNPEPDRRSGFRTRSLLTAPMHDNAGKPVGVLQAVNKRGERFHDADLQLIRLLADQAGVAIQRYGLQQEAVQAAELTREMNLALQVQQAMIPKSPPQLATIRCAGFTRPASITGGDAYDLWPVRDECLGVFLGDAAGHGIAPALVVSQARTLVRALCDLLPDADPLTLVTHVNARLCCDMADGRFVTMFLGEVDESGLARWTSAGHGPILVQRRAGAPVEQHSPPGPPVGVLDPFLGEPVEPIQLEPGGRLLVISDGLFEAFSPGGQLLGVEAIVRTIEAIPTGAPPETVLDALRHVVEAWQQGNEPKDDQTAVVITRM
jgi:phosphoserine phosphatase